MREKNPSSGGRSRGWGKRPGKAPKIWSFIWSRPVQATFGSLQHSNAGSLVICLCKSEIFHQGKDSKWMGKAHAGGVQPVAKAAAVKPVVGQWEGWFLCMGCTQAANLTVSAETFLRRCFWSVLSCCLVQHNVWPFGWVMVLRKCFLFQRKSSLVENSSSIQWRIILLCRVFTLLYSNYVFVKILLGDVYSALKALFY